MRKKNFFVFFAPFAVHLFAYGQHSITGIIPMAEIVDPWILDPEGFWFKFGKIEGFWEGNFAVNQWK